MPYSSALVWTLPRVGVAVATAATCFLPFVHDGPERWWYWVIAVLGGLAAVGLLAAAILGSERMPRLILDPAASLAMFVLLADGMDRVLEDDEWAAAVRYGLFDLGVAIVALAIMLQSRRVLRTRRAAP